MMQAQSAACPSKALMARLLLILGCPLLPAPPYEGSHTLVPCVVYFSLTGSLHMQAVMPTRKCRSFPGG